MVQRKVPSKLGTIIQATDSNKSEILKPYFHQQQQPDLKTKKMKKSRSFKKPDVESQRLSYSGMKKNISLPGKPPPEKSSPNYMKSTSSSEHKQVSSPMKIRTSSSNGKINSIRKSKSPVSSAGSSVRNLTKIPSFKKSSSIVICSSGGDRKEQRATCSSTLKDAKFPPFLELSPGATEAEGTSTMKVCPYTYCSLNGHHHPPLPPLKCFLSAKRRSLKLQKSFKLGALSPRKAKVNNGPKMSKESDSSEFGKDFFFEIYTKTEEEDLADFSGEIRAVLAESLSEGSPKSEIDFEDFTPIKSGTISKDQGILDENDESTPSSTFGISLTSSGDEDRGSVEEGDNFSQTTDMEWEEGEFSTPEPGNVTKADLDLRIDYVIMIDDFIGINNEKIFTDEILHEEESACSDAPNDSDSEMDGEVLDSSQVFDSFSYDQKSSDEEFSAGEQEEEEIVAEVIHSILKSVPGTEEDIQENAVPESDNQTSYADNQEGTRTTMDSDSGYERLSGMENQNISENDEDALRKRKTSSSMDSEEQDSPKLRKIEMDDKTNEAVDRTKAKNANTGIEETLTNLPTLDADKLAKLSYARGSTNKEDSKPFDRLKWKIGRGRILDDENEESWKFNPAEPNYIPLQPEPEAEKVDLKHQMTDDRKNSEEFMLDYALQQAVSKLAPARKKKVAMLVAAFETVLPVHPSPRQVQACS
ncbi:uncharacterized protein [Rutidosis leptorrhynchoides]|uniref:uncharacterized protein n=1 Tax=Rutidosis leptorrhynchoides TaxID=125765 RepID=UPI003A9A4807